MADGTHLCGSSDDLERGISQPIQEKESVLVQVTHKILHFVLIGILRAVSDGIILGIR